MKFGFFSPTINRVGGGEWVTLNMIESIKAKNQEIMVYSAEKTDPIRIREFVGHDLSFGNEMSLWPNIFDPYSLENIYPNLVKSFLFKQKCDFLIDTFSNALFPWSDAVYFHGRPRLLRLPKGIKGYLFMPYKAFLNYSSRARAKPEEKTLMACSRFSARTVEKLTELTVNVLYPPVSDFFRSEDISKIERKNTVVTVMRISKDKRPETIPQIAKLVSDKISFEIVGSCKLASEFKVLACLSESIRKLDLTKKVKLRLNVSREEQRNMLQSSKIYLHPSNTYEAFGVAAVEAMASGCIPIVPDIGGLKEIVPEKLRYHSLEEAASLVESSIANWSWQKPQEFADLSDRFSQKRFQSEFLKIMKL